MPHVSDFAGTASREAGAREVRVLIIDDSASMRSIIRRLLKQSGLSMIDEAANGKEALARLRDKGMVDPDVIICDLHMEEMDGVQFCNAVRRDDEIRGRGIPILILTGDTERMLHDVSLQVGAVKVLTKPISAEQLHHEIQEAVGFLL